MDKKIRELMAKKAQAADAKRAALAAATSILDAADGRDLNDDEKAAYAAQKTAAEKFQAQIDQYEERIALENELNAAKASAPALPTNVEVTENVEQDPRRGFKNAGEFAAKVFAAAQPSAAPDRRLILGAAAGTFGSDAGGADGGFLVPPEFSREVFRLSLGEDSLLPLTDSTPIESNSMVFPKDETTPWGTDGVRAYWQGEATASTATKPKLGAAALRLKKLMALVPVTDELLEDYNALDSYLTPKLGDSVRWKLNEAILFGSGAGLPQGALSSSAVVTVAKDSGQATGTLTTSNCANMIARLPPGSFGKSVWIINNDVLPALFTLTLGNYPVYLPMGAGVGGVTQSPYGTLFGRPVLVSQHANTFSSVGDVTLVDLSYYQTITKAGGIKTDTSMHLYFDAGETAFRVTFRADGLPKIAAAITPAKGSNKLSPFVQLGAR